MNLRAGLSLGWAGLILVGSFLPRVDEVGPAGIDKVSHLLAYLILGVLAQSAWGWRSFWLGVPLALITELGQGLIPERTLDPLDLLSNLAGLILGAALLWLYKRSQG